MIRNVITVASFLLLAGVILSVSLGRTCLGGYKAYSASPAPSPSVTPDPTPTIVQKVDYYLAYPGILPDQPLYKLKMVRDQIRLMLVKKSPQKVALLLLYADKRVGAGVALIEGGQMGLGITTMQKGVKYYEQALFLSDELTGQGADMSLVKEAVNKAPLKYIEKIDELLPRVTSDQKSALESMKIFLQSLVRV